MLLGWASKSDDPAITLLRPYCFAVSAWPDTEMSFDLVTGSIKVTRLPIARAAAISA
jgi:hypothetical protein